MPFYEYTCQNCGHELEALQKMSDEPLTECPGCKQSTLIKKVSAPAFHLKGDGWYVTDFKDKNKKTDKASEKKAGEATSKPTKSDT